MTRCEDYPCCGHTDGLPCDWTYTPEAQAFDRIHAFCDHEAGVCDADDEEGEPEERLCDFEFGHHKHDDAECARILSYMSDPFEGSDPFADDIEAYGREAEESMLGRPLFPNEY